MRILSDGSATTNYLGVAIDNANGAFSATFYMHSGGDVHKRHRELRARLHERNAGYGRGGYHGRAGCRLSQP